MFIIIEYTIPNYDKITIVKDSGQPIIFGSKHTAQLYASAKNLSKGKMNYKIVEL